MDKKEREEYKKEKIRSLYIFQHFSLRAIAETLSNDPEFVRITGGKIAYPTVNYWVKQIKEELEKSTDSDGMERFVAEFIRKSEFMDGEISDLTKMIASPSLKMDDKIKLITLRHRIAVDQVTLLADRELPLTVKKYKKDRHAMNAIKVIPQKGVLTHSDIPEELKNRIGSRPMPESSGIDEQPVTERKYVKTGTTVRETIED